MTPHLRDLAMPAARLEVLVEPVEPTEWGEDGGDRVTFLFSANPGEPARPLAKAASGGELSVRCWPSGWSSRGAPDVGVRRDRRRDRW